MKTAKELVNEINAANICSPHYIDDEVDLDGATQITTQDFDEHRWYVLGTVVFRTGNEFFGVFGPVSIKSESMGYRDLEIKCEAFEMEAVPAITYRRKS